jgi:hypothetical protein
MDMLLPFFGIYKMIDPTAIIEGRLNTFSDHQKGLMHEMLLAQQETGDVTHL